MSETKQEEKKRKEALKHFLKRKQTSLSTDIVKRCRDLEYATFEFVDKLDKRSGRKKWETVPYGMRIFYDALIEDARDIRMNIIAGYKTPKDHVEGKKHFFSMAQAKLDDYEADIHMLYQFGNGKVTDEEMAKFIYLVDSITEMTQKLAYSAAVSANVVPSVLAGSDASANNSSESIVR